MSDGSTCHRERVLVGAMALVAALRTIVFAAAFPFFTNVDEHRHVDMVLAYAQGELPRSATKRYDPEFPRLLALYGSQEYVHPAGRPPRPPTWQLPPAVLERRIAQNRRLFGEAPNLESFQSPVYYGLAGAWLAVVRALGVDWGRALYAVRFLGAASLAALVLLAWSLLRRSHPDCATVRLGAPALLAAVPLDVFHYVTPDSLAPLTGGAAFALALRCALAPEGRTRDFALAGLTSAVAFLTKSTLVVMIGLWALVALFALRGAPPERRPARLGRLALAALAVALPLALFALRALSLTGSALGTAAKVQGLGWGVRPVSQWAAHPLFTPSGAWEFLSGLLPIFWRGEVVWHRVVLAWPAADVGYGVTTLCFGLAALAFWRSRGVAAQRVEAASLFCVAGALAVLVVLSLRFVFSDATNPSAAHPYFVQGRLVSGVWLPFAILYTRGLARLCAGLPGAWAGRVATAALAAIAALALLSELWLAWPVFASPYNFFHLPGAHG